MGASYSRQFVKKFRACAASRSRNRRTVTCRPLAKDGTEAMLSRCFPGSDTDERMRAMPEILSTSRPTGLRLAGFVALAGGGLLLGVGALLEWVVLSFPPDIDP